MNAIASVDGNKFLDVLNSYQNNTMLPDGRGLCNNVSGGCIEVEPVTCLYITCI
jgi:hypothetical protein